MADEALLEKVQNLSDLELAALLSLLSQEHCIVDTEPEALDDVVREIQLIASNVFGLSHVLLDCSEHTTLDDFANSILVDDIDFDRSNSPMRSRNESSFYLNTPTFRSISRSPRSDTFVENNRKIANVIIAKNFDESSKQIQLQALELIRTKRIYSHSAVQTAPKRFLFIVVLGGGQGPRLTKHLNDHIFISHFHDPEDGYPNCEEFDDDGDSISSVITKKTKEKVSTFSSDPVFPCKDVDALIQLGQRVKVSVECKRYLHDITSFLRLHRAVAGGISPLATRHFEKLVKSLAPLHGLDYVSPSLVVLAAKKIYLHRIEVVLPQNERSLQWGSDLEAVAELLDGFGAEEVIDDTIAMVEVPA